MNTVREPRESTRSSPTSQRELLRGGDRVAAVSREPIQEVLESDAATPKQRIGAALARMDANVLGSREHVRIVADPCADHGLRSALEHVAAGNTNALKTDLVRIPAALGQ